MLTAGEGLRAHLRALRASEPGTGKAGRSHPGAAGVGYRPIAWAEPPDDQQRTASAPGARLGPYTLIREIGQGGSWQYGWVSARMGSTTGR